MAEMEPVESSGAEWYYGDQEGVENFLGTANLQVVSNLSDATDTDAANADRILSDGLDSDSEFDVRLAGGPYVVPITVGGVALNELPATNKVRRFFRQLSNRDVACRLNDHRMILVPNGATAEEFDKAMNAFRADVRATLEKIKAGELEVPGADQVDDDHETPPGTVQFIPINRGTVCDDD